MVSPEAPAIIVEGEEETTEAKNETPAVETPEQQTAETGKEEEVNNDGTLGLKFEEVKPKQVTATVRRGESKEPKKKKMIWWEPIRDLFSEAEKKITQELNDENV